MAGMQSCSEQYPACELAACYPCYCGGLAAVDQNFAGDGDWLAAVKYECSPYIDSFDWRSMGIRCVRGWVAGWKSMGTWWIAWADVGVEWRVSVDGHARGQC